jgi:hypothetical protein
MLLAYVTHKVRFTTSYFKALRVFGLKTTQARTNLDDANSATSTWNLKEEVTLADISDVSMEFSNSHCFCHHSFSISAIHQS